MIKQIIMDCLIEGRKYVEGMIVEFPDHITFPDGFAKDTDECNIVITHRMDDPEKEGVVEPC